MRVKANPEATAQAAVYAVFDYLAKGNRQARRVRISTDA
jgi:hypothetical protein